MSSDGGERELCAKFPFLPQCKKFVEGLDAKEVFTKPEFAPIVERAFERLNQALESGLVSKNKISDTITEDELKFHELNGLSSDEFEAKKSWNVLYQFFNGKIKVVKT